MKRCAFNGSPRNSYVDHIGPLASLLDMPLLMVDEKNVELTSHYYPEVRVRYMPDFEFRLKEVGEEFDTLFDCDYWNRAQKNVFFFHTQKEMKVIFCPHGQSDKGYQSDHLSPYAMQERVLLYGDLMKEMLIDLKLWDAIAHTSFIGNFRRRYYEKHRERLLQIAEQEIFSRLNRKNPTLLFAPTWNDLEQSGSFFTYGEELFRNLPSHWNLIIKVHPDLSHHDPVSYYQMALLEEKRPNFLLIETFPCIYPLLESVDVYLGDYSSIGYDFLSFERPMFFLQKSHLLRARLHTCGEVMDPNRGIYRSIEEGLPRAHLFKERQRALYKRAFASVENIEQALQ